MWLRLLLLVVLCVGDMTQRIQLKIIVIVFFFKQKTAYEMRISDCSSDVCSSDLRPADRRAACHRGSGVHPELRRLGALHPARALDGPGAADPRARRSLRDCRLTAWRSAGPAARLSAPQRQRAEPHAFEVGHRKRRE